MKRSEINRHQRAALALFADYRFALPPFATWGEKQWSENLETASYCRAHQMGWDITDFGSSDFAARASSSSASATACSRKPLAGPMPRSFSSSAKARITPTHSHRIKMEDIIVRGGGNLILELHNMSASGDLADTPVEVRVDGTRQVLEPGAPLRLSPGQSVTITRNLWHRFYGEAGKGAVFVGEVSQVNDDLTDNYFFDKVGRFPAIDEDEPKLFPLWNELPQRA